MNQKLLRKPIADYLSNRNANPAGFDGGLNERKEHAGKALPILPHHVGPFQFFEAGPEFSTPIFDLNLWRNVQASQASMDASRHFRRPPC